MLSDFAELTKPSIVAFIVMSTAAGAFMAVDGPFRGGRFLHGLLATALLAAGMGALNQWSERVTDARMRRTASRPIPSGRIEARAALPFAIGLAMAGLAYLQFGVNGLGFVVGVGTLVAYNFVYTPLKTRTWLSTAAGAVPGAVPPLLGWVVMRGDLSVEGWVLYAVLFLWQFPHVYAISWMYREDYGRAGIVVLPVVEPSGESTVRWVVATGALLVPVSLAPAWLGMVSWWYVLPALLVGAGYLAAGLRLAAATNTANAKRLLRASVMYLPLLYAFLCLAKR